MSMSNSRLAYKDAKTIFDAALDSPKGIRIESASKHAAYYLRNRLTKFRSIDRADLRKVLTPEDPMYGLSPYDELTCRVLEIEPDRWVIEVRRHDAGLIFELIT